MNNQWNMVDKRREEQDQIKGCYMKSKYENSKCQGNGSKGGVRQEVSGIIWVSCPIPFPFILLHHLFGNRNSHFGKPFHEVQSGTTSPSLHLRWSERHDESLNKNLLPQLKLLVQEWTCDPSKAKKIISGTRSDFFLILLVIRTM